MRYKRVKAIVSFLFIIPIFVLILLQDTFCHLFHRKSWIDETDENMMEDFF